MSKHLQKFSSFQSFQKEQQASNRLLYVYRNSVYDLTDFADRHPGGRGALNIYKGRDLENVFFNPSIHKHSTNALQVLEQYKCGIIEIKQQSSIFNSKSTNFTTSQMSKKPQASNDTKTQPNKKTPLKSQSVKPKPSHNEDRLNQSMNNLNQSMTSSVKSHFLHIPSQMEIIQLQKQKQKQLIQSWKQTEIDELKRQQAEVLKLQQEKNQTKDDRRVQSEIISTQKKSFSPYYQAWLDKKKNQLNETSTNNILPSYLTQSNRQDDESTIQNDTVNSNTFSILLLILFFFNCNFYFTFSQSCNFKTVLKIMNKNQLNLQQFKNNKKKQILIMKSGNEGRLRKNIKIFRSNCNNLQLWRKMNHSFQVNHPQSIIVFKDHFHLLVKGPQYKKIPIYMCLFFLQNLSPL